MFAQERVATESVRLSIIIPTYNDWTPLHDCLRSLCQQHEAPAFEVIIVDDGSREPAPESIREFSRLCPLTVLRQEHAGVSAARNHGMRCATAALCLFTDADCRLHPECLARLYSGTTKFPEHNAFQLHIVGNCSNIVARAEHLRLTGLQDQLLERDGRIRYLNTAGFAIRRSSVEKESIFDCRALRAEDTMLLADLIDRGELPHFLDDAIIEHTIPLSLIECLRKDIQSAFIEVPTYKLIAAKGIRLRMRPSGRLGVLLSMWRKSRQPSIGRLAWGVAMLRQVVQRLVSIGCVVARIR